MPMTFYYGGFPPPYGGVTVKNQLLWEHLSPLLPMKRMDTLKAMKNPFLLIYQTANLVLNRRGRFVVATSNASRRRIVMLLHRFNRNALKRSCVMVMGGSMAEDIASDHGYIHALGQCRRLFVETASMKGKLEALGLTNVSVYPNCRAASPMAAVKPTRAEDFRCLFFSRISPEKGADTVLDAAEATPHIRYEFWGEIDKDYENTFHARINALPNAAYLGIFRQTGDALYRQLHTCDILLLPTRYKQEGVPGILVEGKLAALPAIVSDIRYNREIVEHGVAGIVLEENTSQQLIHALNALSADPALTDRLKQGALDSGHCYLIENHLELLQKWLCEQ